MPKQPESYLKEKVLADLKKLPNCFAEKIQQVGTRATPDILACVNGWHISLELKRDEKEKPDALQEYKLNRYAGAGGFTRVVHPLNWDSVLAELKILASYEPKTLPNGLGASVDP